MFPWLAVALTLWSPLLQARWLTEKEAGSVLEKFHMDLDVKKNGAWTQTVDYVLRVQAEDAKTSASLFNLEYNSLTDKVEVLEAYTLNGETKIPVEPSAIEDRDKGESKEYDAVKVRSVAFPHVQIGSLLHIRYRYKVEKPLIQDRWSNEITLGPSTLVKDFKLQVNSERPLVFELQDARNLVKVRQPDKFHLLVTNKQALPGWVQAEKEPFFHPDGYTNLWISTESDWSKFMSTLNTDYEKIQTAGLPAKLQSWVREGSKKKTVEDQILFLMEKMSRDFRYFGDWRRHNGGLVPRPLKDIERSRYGDCKDLASLLTSLLRAMNVKAYVALVRRGANPWGHEPDYKTPASGHFNHAIVQVQLPNRTLWLDATNPVASLKPYSDISGRPAWILDPKGAHFDRLPDQNAEDYKMADGYEYRFRGRDQVAVRVDAWFRDQAAFRLANDLMMAPRSEVLTSTLDFFSEGQQVKSFHYQREPQTGRILNDMNVLLEYEAGRVTYNAGQQSFFVIPDGILTGAFYETGERESDIKLSEQPFSFSGTRRLKDMRLVQEPGAPCRVESEWMTIERSIKKDGNDVLISSHLDLKRPYIKKSEFLSKPFRRLQEETKRCFYRSGVLIEPLKGWG